MSLVFPGPQTIVENNGSFFYNFIHNASLRSVKQMILYYRQVANKIRETYRKLLHFYKCTSFELLREVIFGWWIRTACCKTLCGKVPW